MMRYDVGMVITMREQEIIKTWNKKGLAGLRLSSLALLDNIGGGDAGEDVAGVLIRHTIKALPQGLWGGAEKWCQEICFVAGLEFDEEKYLEILDDERGEREDVEFDD